jgi:hypothetical protein
MGNALHNVFKLRKTMVLNADGGGVNDATSDIQTQIAEAAAKGLKLRAPPGTYMVTTLTPPADLRLEAEDENVVFKRHASATGRTIDIISVSDVRIVGIDFDLNNVISGGGQAAINVTGASPSNSLHFLRCKFRNGGGRPYINFQQAAACERWYLEGMEFFGNTAGSIRILSQVAGSKIIRIKENLFDGCGGAIVQIRPSNGAPDPSLVRDFYLDLALDDNIWTDLTGGTDGPIPLELFSTTGGHVNGSIIDSGTRGLNGSGVKDFVYDGNTVSNQTQYFMEIQNVYNVRISDSISKNNAAFIHDTSSECSKKVTISGGRIEGGGAAYNTVNPSHIVMLNTNATGEYDDWQIDHLDIADPINVRNIVRVDSNGAFKPKNIRIQDITITATDEKVPVTLFSVNRGTDVKIKRIKHKRTANITLNTPTLAATSLYTFAGWTVGQVDNLEIDDYEVEYTGADTRAGGNKAIGLGQNAADGVLPGLKIGKVTIKGDGTNFNLAMKVNVTSGDTKLLGPFDLSTTGAANAINAAVYTGSGAIAVGDAAYTFTPNGVMQASIVYSTPITADRAVTLTTTGTPPRQKLRVIRTAACTGAFNVNVGLGPLKALGAAGTWADFEFHSGAWMLVASGTL